MCPLPLGIVFFLMPNWDIVSFRCCSVVVPLLLWSRCGPVVVPLWSRCGPAVVLLLLSLLNFAFVFVFVLCSCLCSECCVRVAPVVFVCSVRSLAASTDQKSSVCLLRGYPADWRAKHSVAYARAEAQRPRGLAPSDGGSTWKERLEYNENSRRSIPCEAAFGV